MKSRTIAEFACEFEEPELSIDPIHDDDTLRTLRGALAHDRSVQDLLREAIGPREPSELIDFVDTLRPLDNAWLLDRFNDATSGIDPGNPSVKKHAYDPGASVEEIVEHDQAEAERCLDRFFAQTNTRPRLAKPRSYEVDTHDVQDQGTWGGVANKPYGNVLMPHQGALAKSFLHELGHCCMGRISFSVERATDLRQNDINHHPVNRNFKIFSNGLQFNTIEGERGIILEESVAEALGSLVNKKLGIVVQEEAGSNIPDKLKPYMINDDFSLSSPSAVALELIADEIGMPFERYLKLLTDYANIGIHNVDARQEVAETIYRGTRGKLKMSQVESLPYPTNPRASLALLWAVENALEVPDHARYSQHFFPDHQ
jgi:hypothetical protein